MYGHSSGTMVSLSRDVRSIQIPEGTPVILHEGTDVWITQVLGGMFTVQTEYGYLVRIDGKDADSLGQTVPPESKVITEEDLKNKSLSELVWEQLRLCYDPEIPANIVDLGLLYKCELHKRDDGITDVDIQMTLTAPGCGMGDVLKNDVETKLKALPTIGEVRIELVFEPPWEYAMMSDTARLQLGMM